MREVPGFIGKSEWYSTGDCDFGLHLIESKGASVIE